ncbi:hypothetical protein PRIPAC_91797, partial [Pristionchus pacificus]|uniref:Uncharacterized protein n=1 Tax=Pristionchus pacificus TaxID=54126 RepID=A0A2A6BAB7_PRIPA
HRKPSCEPHRATTAKPRTTAFTRQKPSCAFIVFDRPPLGGMPFRSFTHLMGQTGISLGSINLPFHTLDIGRQSRRATATAATRRTATPFTRQKSNAPPLPSSVRYFCSSWIALHVPLYHFLLAKPSCAFIVARSPSVGRNAL